MIWTPLCEMLEIKHPIIQGGMGPFSTNNLCVAVSNAGAMGLISTSGLFAASIYGKSGKKYLYAKLAEWVGADENIKPTELLREILYKVLRETKSSGGSFGANVMVSEELLKPAREYIDTLVQVKNEDSDMERRFKLVVTSAGDPIPWKEKIKNSGLIWFHVIPFVRAAQRAQRAGVDGIIASGHEAGFHVAWDPVHTMVLLPAVVEAVDRPVVGAGGFCDGKTLAAALALGAVGIQMGTRFIATKESDFPQLWKQMILNSPDRGTIVTRAFVGPGRFIKSPQSLKLAELTAKYSPRLYIGVADDIFQVNPEILRTEIDGLIAAFTQDEQRALTAGGECVQRISDLPSVSELIQQIVTQAEQILESLPRKYIRAG